MNAEASMETSEVEARELSADQVAALARDARPSDWLVAADASPASSVAPRGWLLRWPKPGGGYSWLWNDGPNEPTHVPFPRIALYAHPAPAIPPEIAAIAARLHTQDNRITDNPLFAVQQKRRVYGLDEDYEEGHGWSHPDRDNLVLEGEPEFAGLESAWESGEEPQGDWRRVGFRDTWEFVTGGLTEQGCKDYIARNGHNLTEPRIYAYGSYRNAEFIALRKWLMSLVPAPASADQPHVGPKAEEAAES